MKSVEFDKVFGRNYMQSHEITLNHVEITCNRMEITRNHVKPHKITWNPIFREIIGNHMNFDITEVPFFRVANPSLQNLLITLIF